MNDLKKIMPQFDNWSYAGRNSVLVKINIINGKIVIEKVEPNKSWGDTPLPPTRVAGAANSKSSGIHTIKKPISKNSVDFIPLERTPT